MTVRRIKKPVIAGSWYPGDPRTLREEIELFFSRKVLIVGRSDLSHYHAYEKAVVMELRALDDLVRMDAAGLLGDPEAGPSEACGGGPAAVTVMAGPKLGADRAELPKYSNSGDVRATGTAWSATPPAFF